MANSTHVVFTTATATAPNGRRVTYGVYLDLNDLNRLALKVSHNKSRKGKDGPVHIEIHSVEPGKPTL